MLLGPVWMRKVQGPKISNKLLLATYPQVLRGVLDESRNLFCIAFIVSCQAIEQSNVSKGCMCKPLSQWKKTRLHSMILSIGDDFTSLNTYTTYAELLRSPMGEREREREATKKSDRDRERERRTPSDSNCKCESDRESERENKYDPKASERESAH